MAMLQGLVNSIEPLWREGQETSRLCRSFLPFRFQNKVRYAAHIGCASSK